MAASPPGLDRDEGTKKEEIVKAPRSSVGTLRMRLPLAPQVHGCQVVESQNMITPCTHPFLE